MTQPSALPVEAALTENEYDENDRETRSTIAFSISLSPNHPWESVLVDGKRSRSRRPGAA